MGLKLKEMGAKREKIREGAGNKEKYLLERGFIELKKKERTSD